jgi:hypothetical protein
MKHTSFLRRVLLYLVLLFSIAPIVPVVDHGQMIILDALADQGFGALERTSNHTSTLCLFLIVSKDVDRPELL